VSNENAYTNEFEGTLWRAKFEAHTTHYTFVTCEHLLLALFDDKDALGVFKWCEFDTKTAQIETKIHVLQESPEFLDPLSAGREIGHGIELEKVLWAAKQFVRLSSQRDKRVNGAHVLVALTASESRAGTV
jgi:ATP-dependent Clp protease ATP-binding subunit ClpA